MRIFDTHAHYDSRQFNDDRDELLRHIHEENGSGNINLLAEENSDPDKNIKCEKTSERAYVGRIINVGADMKSSQTTLELAGKYDHIYAAVGVHPDSAGELIWCPEKCLPENPKDAMLAECGTGTCSSSSGAISGVNSEPDGDLEENVYKGLSEYICDENRELLRVLATKQKVIAIGEIGLDYHWDIWPREIQKQAFKWQWELAQEFNLPVIIHSRDAAEDTLNMVRDFYGALKTNNCKSDAISNTDCKELCGNNFAKEMRAVMHCYSYSPEHAEEYLKMGLMFGIGGVVTFKNAKKLKEVVDLLPLDRIMLETDCPYMAPDPFRGKRNDSGYLTYVAEKIAEIKGINVKTVYDRTWENAEQFFGITD